MDVAVKNRVFSQFDTTKTRVNNYPPKETPAAALNSEAQTKKSKNKHKDTKALLGFSMFGALHGIYKKRDPKIVQDTTSVHDIIVKAIPASEAETKVGVKKIVAEKSKQGWVPVGFFDVVKEADRTKCTRMPVAMDDIVQINDTKNFYRSSKFSVKEGVPYGTFSRVLNPYDERFFKAFGKIPFCNRIADYMTQTRSPIKELNIGKHKLYYNLNSIIKGAAFAAWTGAFAIVISSIIKSALEKRQETPVK